MKRILCAAVLFVCLGSADLLANDQIFLARSDDGVQWMVEAQPRFEDASAPEILVRKNGQFLLYWSDSSGIAYSVSKDGWKWSTPARVKIQNSNGAYLTDPSVMELGRGKLRLFYYVKASSGPDTVIHKIKSAVSKGSESEFMEEKGVRFTAPGIADPDVIQRRDRAWIMYLAMADTNKVLIAKSKDGLSFKDTGVRIDGAGIPSAVVLGDGRIRLFGNRSGGIISFISKDGLSFQKEPGMRIRQMSGTKVIADPSVTRTKDGKWVMAFKRRA